MLLASHILLIIIEKKINYKKVSKKTIIIRSKYKMAYCYYPTTTIAIDDDVEFLETITQRVGIAACNAYSSPDKAIECLRDEKSFQRIKSRLLKTASAPEEINVMPEDQAFLINLHGLHQEIYSDKRFNDISVI